LGYRQYSDEFLLQSIGQKDSEALEEFYDRYAQVTYNLIVRIVRDRAIADELLQETFWQVWQKASEFSGRGAPAAWLYRIARNKSLDHLRRQKARPQPLETLSSEETEGEPWDRLATAQTDVEQATERQWDYEYLRHALAEIPGEQRVCLELAYFDGLSQSQIAQYIDIPLGTVKTRLRIGLQKLQRILQAAGYQAPDIER
jgi:RNA polymerase sigma-70 factor (ECF subfamily)